MEVNDGEPSKVRSRQKLNFVITSQLGARRVNTYNVGSRLDVGEDMDAPSPPAVGSFPFDRRQVLGLECVVL
jgi:hypothetical protein